MTDVKEIMASIIDRKYNEVIAQNTETGPFDKIKHFEGNAVGQIGEEFVKTVFYECGININNRGNVIHDEFDILLNNTKIEIKTARKGKNDTFQFNGINPRYNADFIILIGISPNNIYSKVLDKSWCHYDHPTRSYYFTINGRDKKLVQMNPGNDVNYKLTMNVLSMDGADELVRQVLRIALLAQENR